MNFVFVQIQTRLKQDQKENIGNLYFEHDTNT